MAIQAQWHDVIFESSSERSRAIVDLDLDLELEVERDDDTEGQPPTQAVRRKLQGIGLTYRTAMSANTDPRMEIEAWFNLISQGIHAPFYLNGRQLYANEFLIKKASLSTEYVDPDGRILAADITLEFEEYSEEPGGLKTEYGGDVTLRPGIWNYEQQGRDDYLKWSAGEQDRLKLAQAMGGM